MKNQTCHPIFYILLQVLGIWMEGVFGIGFEIMAVLIFSLGKKRSLGNLFNQGVFVIVVEILIDLMCGDAEMIFETGFWFLEEMRRVILTCSWVLYPIFIFCFFQKKGTLLMDSLFGFLNQYNFFHSPQFCKTIEIDDSFFISQREIDYPFPVA